MKRITALLHAHRLGDILHALEAAGERRLSVSHVHGLLQAGRREHAYSVELGERVTDEVALDVYCEPERVDELVKLIGHQGLTRQVNSGWIFVSEVELGIPIQRDPPTPQ